MNIPEIPFIEFPKISRFSRDIIITEKIDGTNAQVYITDSGDIFAGSRTRWITPEQDNYGFARWVEGNKSELLKLGPGQHFGEWWGRGIQRGYDLKEKRFSLFNVTKYILTPDVITPDVVSVVPILWKGPWFSDSINRTDAAMEFLKTHGSTAAPNFMRPEGIVIFHTASGTLFKKTIEKDEKHKGEL